ncbi:MAG: FtsX-like permease family protein [Nannocystaceae bacterium]|nr:ABC transporter permease [Myxococcales bacterium]
MDTVKLAWRNVWRNPRRSGVTIAAVSLALFVMILYSGMFIGYLKGMERGIVELEVGDAQIFAEGYRARPSIYKTIDDAEGLLTRLDEAGFRGSARLLGSGLAAAGDASSGISMRAVDVARDAEVGSIAEQVEVGAWLDPAAPDEVVIGRKLARTLGAEVGAELVILSQGTDGSMANDLYKVRGILRGISDAVDRGGVFMTHAAFRELMVFPEGAHQIIVRTPAGVPLPEAAARLKKLAPAQDANDWKTLMPNLASMLDSSRAAMMFMFVIIYVAIGIVVLNAMLMAVFERIREFGVLKALGVGPLGVFGLILIETFIQTGVAILIGVAASVPANWYMVNVGIDMSFGDLTLMGMAVDPIWRSQVDASTYVTPILLLLVIITLAVLYPAIRAARVHPVEAMRYQ